MEKISTSTTKEQLAALQGQTARLGNKTVLVSKHCVNTRSGSYDKGFKFHDTEYVVLIEGNANYSFDLGKTWDPYVETAAKMAGRNKIVLNRTTKKEFAYDDIQRINGKSWQ